VTTTGMQRLTGVPAAPGVARGAWATITREPLPAGGRVAPGGEAAEIERLKAASAAAVAALESLSERVRSAGHEDESAIFLAQAAMAADPALVDGAADAIRTTGVDAIAAVLDAAAGVADMLRSLGDELLRARAADVTDVGERIARILAGQADGATLDVPAIVVAEDLSPSLTATLPRERLLGIVLEGSSPTAHAAILARAYGIPAVVGVRGARAAFRAAGPDARVAIDGVTGEVLLDPDDAAWERLARVADEVAAGRERDLRAAAEPAVTLDGTAVTLLANIGTPTESEAAVALGARGVGLFRTEFLFLERSGPPSEDEQVFAYRTVVESFGGDPVTVRLIDVGGDKPIPYIPIAPEENPFLGVRALRLADTHPDLLITQLRACYRAATAGPLKVMAPMVADARDVATFLGLADRARTSAETAGHEIGDVSLGIMLEIPSAVLTADAFFGRLSFASLGTNDLLQYTLAADRGNPALEGYRDSLHPAVLQLIAMAVGAAERAGVELSVCGEMAGDPTAALALVGLGVRSLSMTAPSLPAVRRAIRSARLADLEAAARASLSDAGAADVRERFGALARKVPDEGQAGRRKT